MKIEQISKFINCKPSKIQIAKDDKWEQVWIIDLAKPLPSKDELQRYLQSSIFNYVSIEVIFEQSDGVYIFGMDYNSHLLTKTMYDFLLQSIDATTKYIDFRSFIQRLDGKLIGNSYMFNDELDAIRIGVVNHWLSVGLCVVWQQGWSKHIKLTELQKKLKLNPNLYNTRLNYQGMSFAVNLKGISPGICHWIKSPCCNKKRESWVLSEDKITQYLREWAQVFVEK